MPSDNALLPPTIHLGYLPDKMVIAHLRRARETIRFVGPGLSLSVAKELTKQWHELGSGAVEVVIDADADLCRLGYCDGAAIELLLKTAKELDSTVHRQSGIRLCVLGIDGERIIFAPTPRLVEESDTSASQIILAPSQHMSNQPGLYDPQLNSDDIGQDKNLFEQILAPPELAPRPLTETDVKRVSDDLKQNPPQQFDLARQVRVLSTQFQFAEFNLLKAALARKRVPVPPDLLGLAGDPATEELLRASFQLVGKDDEISGEKLMKRRDEIDKRYLVTIAHYGKVILHTNRADFDKEVEALKAEVDAFQTGALTKLKAAIQKNCSEVVARLLPVVKGNLPKRWTASLGPNPPVHLIERRLKEELERAYGDASGYLEEIRVRLIYKNVTVEMLRDKDFVTAAEKARLYLEGIYEEYQAARTRG